MPTKRLTLAQPAIDSSGVSFPYVDVQPFFIGTFGLTKAGWSLDGDYIVSPFTAQLELSYYRLVGGNRIFLAKDFRPVRAIFEAKNRILDPGAGAGADRVKIADFWDYLYIGTTADLAPTYSVTMSDLFPQAGATNKFEALDINSPFDFVPMVDCLAFLLPYVGGPDFAGLTVVEDAP